VGKEKEPLLREGTFEVELRKGFTEGKRKEEEWGEGNLYIPVGS